MIELPLRPLVSVRGVFFLCLLVILGTTFVSDFIALNDFYYIIWGDREISRSATLSDYFLSSGAELNGRGGGRVPGGGIHYLSYLFMSINPSPKFVQMAIGGLAIISSVSLYLVGKRISGPIAGLVAMIVFLTSPFTLQNIYSFWNPLFGLPFIVFGFCAFSMFLIERRPGYFILAAISMAISAQMHMAVIFSAAFIILYLILSRTKIDLYVVTISVISVILIYSPWILNRLFGWFPEGPMMPSIDTQMIVYDRNILSFESKDFIKIIKNFILRINSIEIGEPAILKIVFPTTAFLVGITGLYFGKWSEENKVKSFISQRSFVYFLIFFVTLAGFSTLITIDFVGGIGQNKNRYYMFLLPPIALLVGISFSALLEAIIAKSRFLVPCLLILSVLVLSIFARSIVTVYSNSKRSLLNMHASPLHDDIVTLANDINKTFGYGSSKLMHRTSYLLNDGRGWYTRIGPANYLLKYLDLKDGKSVYSGCVFVLARPAPSSIEVGFDDQMIRNAVLSLPTTQKPGIMRGNDMGIAKILKKSWAQWKNIEIEHLKIRPKYALVGAKLPFSDCPKSFMNPYIYTEKEILAEEKLATFKDQVIYDKNNNRFFIRYNDGKLDAYVNLMIELKKLDSSNIQVALHSKQLRNSGTYLEGLWEVRSMHNPSLIFKNLHTGKIKRLPIFPGGLGFGPYSTPWRANFKQLTTGNYSVVLTFGNGATAASRRRKILLTAGYEID